MAGKKALKTCLLLLLIAVLACTLAGCKSKAEKDAEAKAKAEASLAEQEAAATDEVIGMIGTVKLDKESKQRIDDARATYDALSETAKEQVSSLDALEMAETEYADLKKEAEVDARQKKEDARLKKEAKRLKEEAEQRAKEEEERKAQEEAERLAAEEAEEEEEEDSKSNKSSRSKKSSKSSVKDPKKVAKSYKGKNVNKLFRKIGRPNSKTIETGCHDGGRDMFCSYSGFSVVAHAKKGSSKFIIVSVS